MDRLSSSPSTGSSQGHARIDYRAEALSFASTIASCLNELCEAYPHEVAPQSLREQTRRQLLLALARFNRAAYDIALDERPELHCRRAALESACQAITDAPRSYRIARTIRERARQLAIACMKEWLAEKDDFGVTQEVQKEPSDDAITCRCRTA